MSLSGLTRPHFQWYSPQVFSQRSRPSLFSGIRLKCLLNVHDPASSAILDPASSAYPTQRRQLYSAKRLQPSLRSVFSICDPESSVLLLLRVFSVSNLTSSVVLDQTSSVVLDERSSAVLNMESSVVLDLASSLVLDRASSVVFDIASSVVIKLAS